MSETLVSRSVAAQEAIFFVASVVLAFGGLVAGSAVTNGDTNDENRTLWSFLRAVSWHVGQRGKGKYICSSIRRCFLLDHHNHRYTRTFKRDKKTSISFPLKPLPKHKSRIFNSIIPYRSPSFSQCHPHQCKLKHSWAVAATTASLPLPSAAEAATATSKPAVSVAPAIPLAWSCALRVSSLMMAEVDITKC